MKRKKDIFPWLEEAMNQLYLRDQEGKRKFLKQKRKELLLRMGLIIAGVMVVSLAARPKPIERQFLRPESGKTKETLELVAEVEKENETVSVPLEVVLSTQTLTKDQAKEEVQKAEEWVGNHLWQEGEKALNLSGTIPDSPVHVLWRIKDRELIAGNGEIHWDQITQDVSVVITGRFSCDSYEETKEYTIGLKKPELTQEELVQSVVTQQVDAQEEAGDSSVILPETIEGNPVSYYYKKKPPYGLYVGLGILLLFLCCYGIYQEISAKKAGREQQLLMDYPELMDKLVLLLSAGLTIPGAWKRITEEQKESSRYLYREMVVTQRDMENGKSAVSALEEFGKRIKLLPYLQLTFLLIQSIRRGGRDLSDQLEYQARTALAERKEMGKRLGEQAGTKLLGPMMLMLFVVLIIIMVPAFITM